MKKVDVVLGLQWGDEGKGKVVDVLTPAYRVIARFQGGPNAGHSLHFEGKKYVLHTIPSGIFRDGSVNVIGNGVVIDPVILSEEIAGLEADGIDVQGKLLISKKAHLILPTHRAIDAASEAAKGKTKIGSTLKGIGPTYMDKTGRNGLRIGDIVSPEFGERYGRLKEKHLGLLRQYDYPVDLTDYEKKWFEGIENLKRFRLIDSEHVVNRLLDEDNTMLAEGAQGSTARPTTQVSGYQPVSFTQAFFSSNFMPIGYFFPVSVLFTYTRSSLYFSSNSSGKYSRMSARVVKLSQ